MKVRLGAPRVLVVLDDERLFVAGKRLVPAPVTAP
jgi:hypothetical protein